MVIIAVQGTLGPLALRATGSRDLEVESQPRQRLDYSSKSCGRKLAVMYTRVQWLQADWGMLPKSLYNAVIYGLS